MGFATTIQKSLQKAISSAAKFGKSLDKLKEQFATTTCPSKEELEVIINKKNKISKALTQIEGKLGTLTKLCDTLDKIIKGLQAAVITIKTLPAPAQFMTAGLLMMVADALVILKDKIKKMKGMVEQGLEAVGFVSKIIDDVQEKLNEFDKTVDFCMENAYKEGTITEEELQNLQTAINSTTNNSSEPQQNIEEGQQLQEELVPNSNNPLEYKGFRIYIENDPENTTSLPKRRAIAIKDETKEKVTGEGSFSSSTEVLVEQMKFEIDKYLLNTESNASTSNLISNQLING